MTSNPNRVDHSAGHGLAAHDRQVTAVMQAVGKLLLALGPQGFTPEAICEGAIRGGAVALLAGTGCGTDRVAKVLTDSAEAISSISEHRETVIQ